MPAGGLPSDTERNTLRPDEQERWRDESRATLTSINAFIDERGLLSNRLRYRSPNETEPL
jgi:hypothetical protein